MFRQFFLSMMIVSWMTASMAAGQEPVDRKAQAGEHFQKGTALYGAGQYLQAIKEFKEAYRLVPKPIILLYIADIYKEAGLTDEAVSYYRRFLDEARMNDPGRPKAEAALKDLGSTAVAPPKDPTPPPTDPVDKPQPKDPVVDKPRTPRKAFKPGELIHTPLEEAQPNHPAKLEVELPDDIKRAWVYLYYRPQGQDDYIKVKFKVDKDDVYYFILPCTVLKGNILQYYIEAVGVSGRRVAGSATSASPFIVDINAANPLQPGGQMSCSEAASGVNDGSTAPGVVVGPKPDKPVDPGKRRPKVFYIAIGSSVATVAMVGLTVLFGQMASMNGVNLEDNQIYGANSGLIAFSGEVADYEKSGKSYQTTMYVTGGLSVVLALASGYFWADYFGKVPAGMSLNTRLSGPSATPTPAPANSGDVFVAPIIGEGFFGVGGTVRF
ncbi:tetratricopeptide repeat protein [Myxococcota bacterium]|nr:tetratricopeptide repeat protein [Myxococcota bacterium]MBU1411728.1 tetratricopeptide repeat protein [Myxococcota bacterium]MBU1509494.1 tetratricopeptide repeat protein [Myxococcota bacterium]